jgi:hypothetical protein
MIFAFGLGGPDGTNCAFFSTSLEQWTPFKPLPKHNKGTCRLGYIIGEDLIFISGTDLFTINFS